MLGVGGEELWFLVMNGDGLGHEGGRPQPLNADETLRFLKLLIACIVVAIVVVKHAALSLVFTLVAVRILLCL